jgi:hypothetical protein
MASGMVMSWEPGMAPGALGEGNIVWAFCRLPSMGAAEPSAVCHRWEPPSLLPSSRAGMPTRTVCRLDMVGHERGVAAGLGPVAVGMASQPTSGAPALVIWWPLGVGLRERDADG